jgi:gag-polypeptide of LTR copia-type
MTNLTKLEFVALDISGKNYLSWTLDAEIHLTTNNLRDTIKDENKASPQEKAKAMIFLSHHLHEDLKTEYLTVKDPLELWKYLKERYDHQKQVLLPKVRYEWIHLRLQDFKSVGEYNLTIFRITSELKLCGEKITDEDILEKIFSIFYASNLFLHQQYQERGFKKYSELISYLLVAE